MATAEKDTLRLEGALAHVARELGVGVWDDKTQSIAVTADGTDEAWQQLNEIARDGAIMRAQSDHQFDDLTDDQLVEQLALTFTMCLDRLNSHEAEGSGQFDDRAPAELAVDLDAGIALAGQLKVLTEQFVSGVRDGRDVRVRLLGDSYVGLDHLQTTLVEQRLVQLLSRAEYV